MALDTANARPGGTGSIAAIHRYPVKSLTAERLERAVLAPGAAMPGDRRFALLRPGAPFDPLAPAWLPKRHCFALVKEERLAQLAARFDAGTGMLTIERDGRPVARGDATSPVGRGLL